MIDVAAEAFKMLRNRATARGGGWSGGGGSSPAIQECPRDTPGEQGGVSSKGTSTHRGQGASEQLLCVLVHLPVPPPTHAHTRPLTLQPTGKELPDSRLVQPLVYMERLELIRNVCRDDALKNLSHTPVSKFVLDRIFVCDKHRILFCQTPKVGNTQWKKVLIVLNGAFPSIEEIPENVVHDHEKNGLPRLSSFSDAEIQKRLKTYFKFFIVRDPFERLISAFKDKFVHNPRFEPWYRHEIAPGIIRKYRRNRTETRGIQFEDFVRYLGDPNHRWLDLQFGDHIIHWVTYVELCAPCEIMYSVIGHHETLEDDAPYILKEAGIDHLVSYPTIPPGITVYNRTKVEHYFLGISKRDIRRLYARFEGDFKLFGYQKPDFLLN
ncbi:carbohydrate sulfotransferase 10 isoform X2 [Papio anubis]|uniref:Carbohydrate sulfotransferase n=1 Tax=Papio anubis TaxID=9555 RepID=A0A8I5NFL5_PAPAN|nr:carbohydrate sulfotransferase 10 isoform X2 [Papio anubis]